MKIFGMTSFRKIFLLTAVFFLFLFAGFFYFSHYFDQKNIGNLDLLLAGIVFFAVFGIIFDLVSYFIFIKPLQIVLLQMQALIVGKPYKQICTTRIDEIGVLAHFFNQVTKGIGEVGGEIKDRDRMLDELTIAAQLQKDILPLKSPNIKGLQIIAKNKPASELGGDIFNFFSVKDKTYIYIGDVTGHGVAAALIMTMATSLISVFADIYPSPYDILVNVNRYIKRHVKKAMFLTMVMLCWDQVKEEMTYVGAGHEHILIYRANTGECQAVISGGIALGMLPDNSKVIKSQGIELNDGDFVILYSDGIIEAKNMNGELYGLERLKKAVIEFAAQYSAEGVNYHIAKDVSAYTQGHSQDDDMSLIVIQRDKSLKPVEVADSATSWAN